MTHRSGRVRPRRTLPIPQLWSNYEAVRPLLCATTLPLVIFGALGITVLKWSSVIHEKSLRYIPVTAVASLPRCVQSARCPSAASLAATRRGPQDRLAGSTMVALALRARTPAEARRHRRVT